MIIRNQYFIPSDERRENENTLEARKHDYSRIKPFQQIRVVERDEYLGQDCVQAFINNNSFPSSLAELWEFLSQFNVEMILTEEDNEWTAPKWAKTGDVVFFMHTKTAITTITRLRSELKEYRYEYTDEEYNEMMDGIQRGINLYKQYGGKIYAIGRVSGGPEYCEPREDDDILHWKSREYSKIDNITRLENPIDISEFRDFIYITRGASITPVFGSQFTKLIEIIREKNHIPDYYCNCVSAPVPLRDINNENWISITNSYRRSFILESQFRKFYVDYLLREIGDQKTFWEECRCTKPSISPSFIDNVIKFQGKYLAVEVKLSVPSEPNIKAQVNKYCYNTTVTLDKNGRNISGDQFHQGKVLIIDTDYLYMYDAPTDTVTSIYNLGDLKTPNDLKTVKATVIKHLK